MPYSVMTGAARRRIRPLIIVLGAIFFLLVLAFALRFRRVHLDHVFSKIRGDEYAVACDVTNPYYYAVTVELEAFVSSARAGRTVSPHRLDEARHSLRVPARSTTRAEFSVPRKNSRYILPKVYVISVERSDGIVTLR